MILVSGVILSGVWLEQVVTRRHFKGHARRRPDVGRCSVARTQKDLQGAVLARLDVFREMVILKKEEKIGFFKEKGYWFGELFDLLLDCACK